MRIIKNIILWLDKNPILVGIILLTACIPMAIVSHVLEWKVMTAVFGVLAIFASLFWLVMFIALMLHVFLSLWQKLVAWAHE